MVLAQSLQLCNYADDATLSCRLAQNSASDSNVKTLVKLKAEWELGGSGEGVVREPGGSRAGVGRKLLNLAALGKYVTPCQNRFK